MRKYKIHSGHCGATKRLCRIPYLDEITCVTCLTILSKKEHSSTGFFSILLEKVKINDKMNDYKNDFDDLVNS